MAQGFTGVKATGEWTISSGHLAEDQYVTFGDKVYTFKNTITTSDGDVYLPTGGNDAADVAAGANLAAAINLSGVAGTAYGLCTTIHPTLSASYLTRVVTLTAKIPGANGNTITLVDNTAQASVGAATMTGGAGITIFSGVKAVGTLTRGATTDLLAVGDTITLGSTTYTFKTTTTTVGDIYLSASSDAATIAALNSLAKVMNGTGVLAASGADGFTATPAHPTIYAGTCTSLTQVFTARLPGVHGNVLPFSEVIVDGQITMDGTGHLGGTTAGSGSSATELKAVATYLRTQQINGQVDAVLGAVETALT